MPTSRYFSQCPEFPSDLAVADIPVISFSNLEDNSRNESERLFGACTDHGFFLLDLRHSDQGARLLQNAETMFDLGAATFNLGPEALQRCAWQPPSLLGYKPIGVLKTDDGKRDTMEMYTVSQDDILGTTAPRQNPETVETQRKDCENFFRHAHNTLCVLLSHLDKRLALAPGTLAALSPLDKPSLTSLRLLSSHPETVIDDHRVTLPGHTDIGTITMLFHVAGGLQILPAGYENDESNWCYVRPAPGCALINLGDTLVEWTGGIVRSSLHRVLSAPGKQGNVTRRSLAYLVRPDHNATMRRLKSDGIVPPPSEGSEEETLAADEWASQRVQQIIKGEVKPQGRGGRLAK